MTRTPHGALAAMVAVLLLATLFYFFNLNAISFWEDESWMVIAISDDTAALWQFAAERGAHPPLYFYLVYVAQPLIGNGEYALRAFGALISLVGVALTYRLGADTLGRRAGMIAALLVAGSLLLVYLTRLARHYTLFYTLSVATVWVYWRWQARPHPRHLLMLAVLQAANLYTHYFSVFIAVPLTVHALLTVPLWRSWRVVAAFALSGVPFLAWIPSIFVQLNSPLGSGLSYGVPDVPRIVGNTLGRMTNANQALGALLTALGLWALWHERRWRLALLLALWTLGTFAIIVIVNQTLFQWFIGRNLLYMLPAVALLYAAGLAWLTRWRIGQVMALVLAGFFVVWGMLAYGDFWPGTPDWRDAMRVVARDARPDDLFVIAGEPYSSDYYLRRYLDARPEIVRLDAWRADPALPDRLWLIDSGGSMRPAMTEPLPAEYQLIREQIRWPVVAHLYQRPPDESVAVFGDQLALGLRATQTITVRAGDVLAVDAWWQPQRLPDFNYSASFQLWRGDQLITQTDGNFDGGRLDAQVLPVGVWTADTRLLPIPPDLPAGDYTLRVTVYDWRDGTRLTPDPAAENDLFPLLTVRVVR